MGTLELHVPLTTEQLEADDFDGVIDMPSDRPLPFDQTGEYTGAVIISTDGDQFIATFNEWHDCYLEGGESSYVYVELG